MRTDFHIDILQRILRRTVMIALFLLPMVMQAQLRSLSVYTGYHSSLSKRIAVQNADAVGAGVDIIFAVDGSFSLGIRSGYTLYSVGQTDQLNGWGWRFWNDRYLNKIQADMKADPSLSAVIGSVQKMDLIPVTVHADYSFPLSEELSITPSVGAGIAFYQRRLYADETWTKDFSAASYSFTYSFRNFAPAKKGNPLFGTLGTTVTYRMFSSIGLLAAVQYNHYPETQDRFGYDNFIFENELTFRFGLEFLY